MQKITPLSIFFLLFLLGIGVWLYEPSGWASRLAGLSREDASGQKMTHGRDRVIGAPLHDGVFLSHAHRALVGEPALAGADIGALLAAGAFSAPVESVLELLPAAQGGETAQDARLAAEVKAKLMAHDLLQGAEIDVSTAGAVVRLDGLVQSKDLVRHAIALAQETPGVLAVEVDGLKALL